MTECNRCGECCENMPLNLTKRQLRAVLAEASGDAGDAAQRDLEENARFILGHWHRSGGGGTRTRYSCDAFDPASRLCTAHDERPPICRGFPWYDRPPGTRKVRLPASCSFNADVGVPVVIR